MTKKPIVGVVVKKNYNNSFRLFNLKTRAHFKYKKIVNFIHVFNIDNKYQTCKKCDIISFRILSSQSKKNRFCLYNIIKKYFRLNSYYDSNTNLFENCR